MGKRCSKRDVAKEGFWREVIEQQADGGQSVRTFCRERGLTESAFYFWRRELKKREDSKRIAQVDGSENNIEKKPRAEGSGLFVPVVAEPLGKTPAAAVEKKTTETVGETSTAVEMVIPSGSVLRWPAGDLNTLAEAVAALEARLC